MRDLAISTAVLSGIFLLMESSASVAPEAMTGCTIITAVTFAIFLMSLFVVYKAKKR